MKKIISFITIVTFLFCIVACDTEQENSVDGTGETATSTTVNGGQSTTSTTVNGSGGNGQSTTTTIYNISYYNTKDAANNNVMTFKNTDNISLNVISCEGYTFLGWFDASTDGNKVVGWTAGQMTADVNLWARWSANCYNVNLYESWRSYSESILVVFNEMMPDFTVPTKEGYQFIGYFDDNETKYIDENGKGCRIWDKTYGGVWLYDRWEEKKHTIIYIGADECENTNPTSFKESQSVSINRIYRIGYTFDGWYDNESYLGSSISYWNAGERTDDVTLYAKWTTNTDWMENGSHIITYIGAEDYYNYSPNSFWENSSVDIYNIEYIPNDDGAILYRTGYVFAGWYDNPSYEGSSITGWAAGERTGDVTLYAKWTLRKCNVRLYYYDYYIDHATVVFGQWMPDLSEIPTRDGYRFVGCVGERWNESKKDYDKIQYVDKDGKGCHIWDIDCFDNHLEIEYEHCIEIQWIADDEHFITYIGADGCNNSANPQSYTESMFVTINDIIKSGYDFGGWYDNETYEGSAITGWESDDKKEDVILYAKWTPITYTVSYDANGGTGDMLSQIFTYDESQDLYECGFTAPTGKQFCGWNTQPDGSGELYFELDTVSNLTVVNNDEITLYAQWGNVNAVITVVTPIYQDIDNLLTYYTADNKNYTFTALAGYQSYRWYIDNEYIDCGYRSLSVSTNSILFNSAGIHTVTVIVTDNQGNSYSGEISIEVKR